MMNRYSFLFALVVLAQLGLAQKSKYIDNDSIKKKMYVVENDTLFMNEIELDEIIVFQPLQFKTKDELRSYLILRRKTKKVWPYAVLAADRLEKLTKRLNTLDSKYEKKRYTKMVQNYIEDKFTKQLKKLTKTEGQILVKLMYRQTGVTAFDLVKDLKSGWRAFWYNTTASLFNISLKEKYKPFQVKEDYMIEDILQRAFKDGLLDKQEPAYDIDYLDLVEKWHKNKKTETTKL